MSLKIKQHINWRRFYGGRDKDETISVTQFLRNRNDAKLDSIHYVISSLLLYK